ncbi:MAG TPA: c-type cytochrome [Usitatibacter sp.]|jgi:cytochrome c5|nr:c-type cytochrome [Usitatibacter sp.]
MSEQHHPGAIEQNIDSHPAKIAIGLAIVAAATIIGIMLLVQFAVGSYGARSLKDDPVMRPERVAERIAPVAQLAIDPNAPAAPAAPAALAAAPAPAAAIPPPAAAAAASGSADAGKKTFDTVCTACHGTGVLGAPKFGDKAAWAPRIAQGKDKLYQSALHGKNAMPAKGGSTSLPDADVKAAVDYMVSAAK